MENVPQTMTGAGLDFLSGLSARITDGVFLEVGPLFGSSTNVINKGRKDSTRPIHTIDTFQAAKWVHDRFGFDLSREMFDKFTNHIPNLTVHQGYAPDVVLDSWKEKIGFYFDDATHGDPGWSANYNFFSKFFLPDTIICGDDFAGGWPDIIRNVYALSEEYNAKLYVIGRVWAMARSGENRIAEVIDALYPALAGVSITTQHGDKSHVMPAASWTWGLHRKEPMTSLAISGGNKLEGQITVYRGGKTIGSVALDGTPVDVQGAQQIYLSAGTNTKFQVCTVNAKGNTMNSKAMRSGTMLDLGPSEYIVAVRLSA